MNLPSIAINLSSILLWGLAATVVLTIMLSASQGLGMSRMSIPYVLGTLFTASKDKAMAVGTVIHMLFGWAFALFYAAVFESWGQSNVLLGAVLGLVHGLFVCVVALPILPALHPRMAGEQRGPTPTRQLQPPGFFGLHYGRQTPMVILLAHVAYGAILGAFYRLAGGV
jgi:hypothetical protein